MENAQNNHLNMVKQSWWQKLATPTYFMELSKQLLPWFTMLSIIGLVIGLYLVFNAPDDYQQGSTVKIMFIHVPFAWLSMLCYTMMTISALGALIWRHPLANISIIAAAPIGAVFTALCLISGSIWGRPSWGAWWVWDARLTSVLVLFLIYLGIIALSHAFDDFSKSARASAILTLVGFINIPLIKFSVDWWNTLHQPASLLRSGGPAIESSLLWPLLVMAIALSFLFVTLHVMAMRNEILNRRLINLQRKAARQNHSIKGEAV
ncbi:heme ABC transporter permease [Bartonella sp. HY328]|uniref:heme ABC transporter permease n=1 Tax=unclassified Bartonella TaxID=2645622 RepID=UPI003965D54E